MRCSIRGLAIALLLLAIVLPSAGCGSGPFGLATPEDEKQIADEKAWDEQIAASTAARKAAAAASATPPPAPVAAEDPVGTWSYRPMRNDGTAAKPKWSEGKSATFTIVKSGAEYSAKLDSTTAKVVFDGKRVTMDGSAQGITVRYAGDIAGDTISGTVHIAAGPLVYDGPWTATRVK